MKTFLFDNSALNTILNDDIQTDLLISCLKQNPIRIVVGIDTIVESFGGRTENVLKRALRLKKLIDNLPYARFIIAKSAGSWLDVEKKHNGRLTNIPILLSSQRWTGFLNYLADIEGFEKFHKSLEEDRLSQQEYQEHLVKRDKQFRSISIQTLDQNEVHKLLENFELNPKTFNSYQLSQILKLSNRKTKKVLSSMPELYKIHRSYLAAFYLRSLGNAFTMFEKYPMYSFLRKQKTGNWADLGIIAQASQFDFLISNDNDQREICNFLSEKEIFRAKALDLDAFLKIFEHKT